MKASWLSVGALAALGLVLPAAAHADTRFGVAVRVGDDGYGYRDNYGYRDGYGYRGYGSRDTYRLGYDRGVREGAEEGYNDGRKGHRFELRSEGDFRHGDEGYKHWMGPKPTYVSGFRSGYAQAYRQSFARGRAERGDWRYDDGRYGYRYDDRYRDDDRYPDRDRIYEDPYQR
jgi:hypothetical protein